MRGLSPKARWMALDERHVRLTSVLHRHVHENLHVGFKRNGIPKLMLAPKALSASSQVPVTKPMLISWLFSAFHAPPHPKLLQLMGFSLPASHSYITLPFQPRSFLEVKGVALTTFPAGAGSIWDHGVGQTSQDGAVARLPVAELLCTG